MTHPARAISMMKTLTRWKEWLNFLLIPYASMILSPIDFSPESITAPYYFHLFACSGTCFFMTFYSSPGASQPSRSRSAASQSTDGTYLRFSENSLIPSLPLSSQCTKSEITYHLHCNNGFTNSHVMKKLLWKEANYQAINEISTLHGHVSQIYYYNETSFIGHPQ